MKRLILLRRLSPIMEAYTLMALLSVHFALVVMAMVFFVTQPVSIALSIYLFLWIFYLGRLNCRVTAYLIALGTEQLRYEAAQKVKERFAQKYKW